MRWERQRARYIYLVSCRTVLVVFDTDCVLCSAMVAFILAHERALSLGLAGAWSEEGLALATTCGFCRSDLNETSLVVRGGKTRLAASLTAANAPEQRI
jgi:predicted DCC family thiol-disulfide oxidoreductase YuxK